MIQEAMNIPVPAQAIHPEHRNDTQPNGNRPQLHRNVSKIPVSLPSQVRPEQVHRQQSPGDRSGGQGNVQSNREQRSPQTTQDQVPNSAEPTQSATRRSPCEQQVNLPNQQSAYSPPQRKQDKQSNQPLPSNTQPRSRQSPAHAGNGRRDRREQGRGQDQDRGRGRAQQSDQDHQRDREQGHYTDQAGPNHDPDANPGHGAQPGSSPSPYHHKSTPEYMGQQQGDYNQYPANHEVDDYGHQPASQVVKYDYAYKANNQAQGRGQGQGKRNRDKEGDEFGGQSGQKRQKNELAPTLGEVEVERAEEEEEGIPFDAFAEVSCYRLKTCKLMID